MKKTKEAIFKDLWPKLYVPETANIEAPVYAAMDEYAQQEAIAFANYLHLNYQPLGEAGLWYDHHNDQSVKKAITTDIIYTQFIDSQNNKL